MVRTTLVAAAVLGLVVAVARSLAAAAPARTVEWSAPAGCPSPSYVSARIAALVGEARDGDRPIDARAQVEAHDHVFRVRLLIRAGDEAGTRTLDAESCLAAADATALIVALTIDPARVAERAADAGAQAEADAAPADVEAPVDSAMTGPGVIVPEERPEVPLAPPSVPEERPIAISAALAFDNGTLPVPAVGVSGAVAWMPTPLRLELTGAYFPTRRSSLPDNPSRGGDFSLIAWDVRGCYLLTHRRVTLAPCMGGELAWVHAQGFGVDVPIGADALWGSVNLAAMVHLALSNLLGVRIQVESAIPLDRPSFELANIAPVHRPAFAAARGLVGVEARF